MKIKMKTSSNFWKRELFVWISIAIILLIINIYFRWCEEGVKDGLLIGLESTLRNLKKSDHVQLLVIGNEISPKFFGKHVIATALNKNRNMKIIIIPKLKDLTNRLFKVPAIIFSVLCSTNIQFLDDFYTKLGIHDELLKNYCTIQNSINLPTKKRKERKLCGETNEIKVCLLEKTSTSSRSFIPTSNQEEETSASSPTEIKMDTSDFISFSKDNISSDFLAKSSSAPLYRPLKFMKIAGNPNRKKK